MFQFPRFASHTYEFSVGYPCGWVSPFRYLWINVYLPTPQSFSQAVTSFFACSRLGIRRMHLFTCPTNPKLSSYFQPLTWSEITLSEVSSILQLRLMHVAVFGCNYLFW